MDQNSQNPKTLFFKKAPINSILDILSPPPKDFQEFSLWHFERESRNHWILTTIQSQISSKRRTRLRERNLFSRRDKEERSSRLFLDEARGGKHSRPRNWDDVPEAPRESYSRWSARRKNRKDRSAARWECFHLSPRRPTLSHSIDHRLSSFSFSLFLSPSRFYSRSVLPAAKLPLLLRGESSPPTSLSCPPHDISFSPRLSLSLVSFSREEKTFSRGLCRCDSSIVRLRQTVGSSRDSIGL